MEETKNQVLVPNIYQKILSLMSELDYIQKGEKTVNGQYRFVSHDQVTSKIHPLLVKHRFLIIPSTENITRDGNRTSVMMQFTFMNVDCPTDQFTVRGPGDGIDGGDKGPGKAISYAFKLACLKMFCLETGEDPDQDANATYEPEKCHQFDSMLPEDLTDKEKTKLVKFLEHSAKSMNKHVEDVKREACNRMDDFIKALRKWNSKKDKE